jgi:transcriptional regulator with XRE-family HTH domain
MGENPAATMDPEPGCVNPIVGLVSGGMTESIYAFVLERLESVKGRWPRVAEESGISLRTIEKIARQEVKDPGVSFIERLAKYFREREEEIH